LGLVICAASAGSNAQGPQGIRAIPARAGPSIPVNPVALILSGKMMLDHLGEHAAADKLENAVAEVIAEGKDVTYDLKPNRNDPTAVGTQEMAEAICKKM
jgi:isocitrate/isopropylmalate dehydrogenase